MAHLAAATSYGDTLDFVMGVTTSTPYLWGREGKQSIDDAPDSGRLKLVVLDCGLKYNILRRFWRAGCQPIVLPAGTTSLGRDSILETRRDSPFTWTRRSEAARAGYRNGQATDSGGKSADLRCICLEEIRLLCHAVGGDTYKLKFGHRGSNHPVKDLITGKVTITSQNHGYAIDPSSLDGTDGEVTQLNPQRWDS